MKKKKHPHTDPNNQVHSEFETSVGNNFKTVIRETPARQDPDNKEEPLNLPEQHENEWDMEDEAPKMSTGPKKVDKMPLLIGLLGVIGLITAVSVVKSLQVNRLTS